jgi:methionyl-tRNA synthetase
MSKPILITSALPYVNNVPHLGNIIGCVLSGDVYNRYLKKQGKEVLYLCGTDEYGTTTEVIAKKENLTCQEVCDKYHKIHKEVYDWFNIKFDIWGRTTTSTQTKLTHEIFDTLYKNNHIEQKTISQPFCESCNMFLADRYIKGNCYHNVCIELEKRTKIKSITNGDQCDTCGNLIDVDKLKDFWCGQCNSNIKPIIKTTKHLFLKLEDFTDKLQDYFVNNKKCFLTDNALIITKSWLDGGLNSRCITRDLQWGTKFPTCYPELKEFENKVFYVWFDAPIGYLSILKHNINDENELNKWYSGEVVNFMAKDNVPFHTIIFPSTLMGCNGKYPLVTKLSSTEYLMYEGTKFSKSKNTGIFGDQIIELSKLLNIDEDYWRYYLIRIRPETKDANFSWIEFINLIKGELCSKIGNYINRCISLMTKYFPNEEFIYSEENKLSNIMAEYIEKYDLLMESFKFRDSLITTLEVADYGNNLLQTTAPWNVYTKEKNKDKTKQILTEAIYICNILLNLLEPIMPKTCEKILKNIITQKIENKCISFKINSTNYKIPFIQLEAKIVFPILDKLNIYYTK